MIRIAIFQGPQYSEEDLVVRERVPIRTERLSVIEPGTNGKHAPIGEAQKESYGANSQEITVSMYNACPEGTEDQCITSPSVEALGRNVHVRRSKRIRNSPQRYNTF